MARPLFSITIPTLNAAATLRACLDSVTCQTFSNYEIIVVDGVSTDETLDIVNSYAPTLGTRLIVHSGPDEGFVEAQNIGVSMSSGEWVSVLGGDDTLYEADTLARVAAFIEEHHDSDLVYGDVIMRSSSSRSAGPFDLDRLVFEGNICHQGMFYRRELFDTIGPYNLRYPQKADYDFNIRCFSNPALVIRYMDIVVAHYNDVIGANKSRDGLPGWPDKEMEKRLPGFIRWSALGMFRRELARLRQQPVEYPSAAAQARWNEEDAQWVFELAQSYFTLGEFDNAREWFARRVEMGGWDEQVYYAMYQIAESMAQLDEPWPDVQDAYLRAWEFRPARAEPLYAIARHYREEQRYQLGYQFARLAATIPLPDEDHLLVRPDIYAWRATDEQAVCASWIDKQAEAFTLCRRLLTRPDVPDEDRQRITGNRDVCVPTMIDAAAPYSDELVRRLADGERDAQLVVSLVAGPDRETTEQTLNSFLRCCLDVSRIGRFLVVDAGLSAKDRARLLKRYGFLEFGDPGRTDGPGAQLAQIRSQIHERLWLHLGQGWRFFAPESFVARLTAVLEAEPQVFQVGINFADAAKLTGATASEDRVRRAPDAGRYVVTDVIAGGPAMFETTRLERAGDLRDTDPDPIAGLERRAGAAGLCTASLDEVLCIATA